MPIRIQNDLPAKEILEKENIFVMDESRALSTGDPSAEGGNPESDAAERRYRASAFKELFQYTAAGGCDLYYRKNS